MPQETYQAVALLKLLMLYASSNWVQSKPVDQARPSLSKISVPTRSLP